MNPPQLCTARLVDTIIFNDKFRQMYFEYTQPPAVSFTAGQYVSLQVSDRGERRAYSICSSPEKTHGFELLIDVTPAGVGTKYLESLVPGDEVKVLAPLGLFTIPQDIEEQALVFVGTGSGIAPFRSMILDQLQVKKDPRPITLYWGLRYESQMFWQDEMVELAESFSNFKFHPVISQAQDEWPLCRGRVTDCLAIHPMLPQAGYYLCGNEAMFSDVTLFLQQKGLSPSHIHHEKFH